MMPLRTVIKRRAIPIATAVMLAQTVFYYRGSAKEVTPAIAPWSQFPHEVGNWKESAEMTMDPAVMNALQPDDYIARAYETSDGRRAVTLFVGYFNSRRDGRAPHSPQWCLPGDGWKSLSSKVIDVALQPSGSFPANEYLIEKGLSKELVFYWYHQAGRAVATEVLAQVYSIPDLILHGRTDVALVRIIVPEAQRDMTEARAAATDFAQAIYPLIRQHIK
jgi:EpsI family protein